MNIWSPLIKTFTLQCFWWYRFTDCVGIYRTKSSKVINNKSADMWSKAGVDLGLNKDQLFTNLQLIFISQEEQMGIQYTVVCSPWLPLAWDFVSFLAHWLSILKVQDGSPSWHGMNCSLKIWDKMFNFQSNKPFCNSFSLIFILSILFLWFKPSSSSYIRVRVSRVSYWVYFLKESSDSSLERGFLRDMQDTTLISNIIVSTTSCWKSDLFEKISRKT